MSRQLSLVEYQSSADGRLYEPEKDIILSTFVNNDMVDDLEACGLFEKFRLYEDSELNSFSEFTRIREDQIDVAIKRVESKLIQVLDSERVEEIKKIQSDDEIAYLMGELYVITSVYRLINLKRDNFAHSANTVIKLG